jgi:N-acetylmuramoyl-L-alanine amidase
MSKLIALDDGHGITTSGKRTPSMPDGTIIHENQFNAPTMGFCAVALQRCGARTMFTAPEDNDIPLSTRVRRANDAKADIFVSFHYNAYQGKWDQTAGGVQTCYQPGSVKGQKLAGCIQKYLVQGTPQVNRGIVPLNLAVTRDTIMPAVLIEAGFMDVHKEAALMLDKAFQKETGEQAAMGICEFLGVQYVPESPPRNELAEAIDIWVRAGLINSPEYWLKNAVPGAEVKGEYIASLIIAGAKKLNEHLP